MQTHLDLAAPAHTAPAEPRPHAPDDSAVHDLADLWVDLVAAGKFCRSGFTNECSSYP